MHLQNKEGYSLHNRMIEVICSVFKLPEAIFSFISGILLSTAINIATSQIPDSFFKTLPITISVGMLLMIIASVLFIVLAVLVKPLQDEYNSHPKKVKDEVGKSVWYEILLKEKGTITKLLCVGSSAVLFTVASLVIIMFF